MSRLVGAFLLLCLHAGFAYAGMDCPLTGINFLDRAANMECPLPLQDRNKIFCCSDNGKSYCCDAEEFTLKSGWSAMKMDEWNLDSLDEESLAKVTHFNSNKLGVLLPVIISAAVIIFLLLCCISCFCCSCCPWYRRRHRGTVYGKVQAPNVVHVVQTPANVVPPSYASQEGQAQNHYVPYPTNPAGYPPQYSSTVHPPPYTSEAYAKQAPYNPAYPPQ